MRARRWGSVVALVVIVAVLAPGGVFAQSVDELRQRLQQLENSTREELESLKRLIREGEAEREKKRKVQEEQERVLESLLFLLHLPLLFALGLPLANQKRKVQEE